MPQIADKCPGIIQFCRTRVTLLDDDGTPASPVQSYVSDKAVSLQITPELNAGQWRTVLSGCECPLVVNRSPDLLLGYNLELVRGVWEPAGQALMLGYEPIYDQSDEPVVIGYNVTGEQLVCGGTQARVALEAWSLAWDGQGPDPDYPYVRHVWPMTRWQESPGTLGVEAFTPGLTGYTQRNQNWHDLYLDMPESGTTLVETDFYSMFLDTAANLPDASCAVVSTT